MQRPPKSAIAKAPHRDAKRSSMSPPVLMLSQQPKSQSSMMFRELFQHVLLNRTGITMSNLPFNKEGMERELEAKQRQEGFAGDATPGQAAGPEEEGNTPGTYVITQDKVSVRSEPSADAATVEHLGVDSVVKVLEVVTCKDDRLLQGRLEHPCGWIALMTTDGRQRWAQKKAEAKWSDNASELSRLAALLGPRNANLSSEAFVKPFFRHLSLQELRLCELDEDVLKFTQLTHLDVSRNPLTCVDHLPPNLRIFKAYNTQIVSLVCAPAPSLCLLGLGHCPISDDGLAQAVSCFGELRSLDLSYSQVADLPRALRSLEPLAKLRQLCLTGSPVCLLPFYRLTVLRSLTKLQLLDGAAVGTEETATAAALKEAAAPRPPSLRLALQPLSLASARVLLAPAMQRVLAERRELWASAAATADAAAQAGEDAEGRTAKAAAIRSTMERWGRDRDAVLEACSNGVLRFRFELPGGAWVETAEVGLDPEPVDTEEGAAEPFDKFELSRLRGPAGVPLLFEANTGKSGDVDGLVELCQWIRKGLAVKVFFRPARPPDPEDAEEEPVVPVKGGKGAGRASPAKAKAAPAKAPKEEVPPEEPAEPQPLPEEFAIGGGVVPIDSFFGHTDADITPEMKESRELPALPKPWVHEAQGARVVPISQWLEPDVQVPLAGLPPKRRAEKVPAAALAFKVTLNAPEEQEEEPPPPVEAPITKSRSKSKK